MASTTKKSIIQLYPHLKRSIQLVQQEVLGYSPPAVDNMRTGYQDNKRQLQAVYSYQYYTAHPSIDPAARRAIPGWKNDQEERREQKLYIMRRNGKGPPKKGSGKKSKKKGGK